MLLIPWCLLSRYIASVYLDIMSPMFLFTQQAVYVVRLTSRIALKMFLMQAGSVCRTCTWRANFEITRLELCMKEPKPAGHFSMTIGPLPPHSVSTGTEVALCPWIAKVLWRTLDLWHPSTIFRHDSWPNDQMNLFNEHRLQPESLVFTTSIRLWLFYLGWSWRQPIMQYQESGFFDRTEFYTTCSYMFFFSRIYSL